MMNRNKQVKWVGVALLVLLAGILFFGAFSHEFRSIESAPSSIQRKLPVHHSEPFQESSVPAEESTIVEYEF